MVCPLAGCVSDAFAQPRPAPRDAGRALGALGGFTDRRVGGTYVVAQRADAGAAGTLPREVIREAVRARMSDVRRCYEAGLAFDRDLAGRVTVEFTLDAQGAVTGTRVVEDGLDRPQVGACIAEYAQRWSFPAPGGPFQFRYPFHLRAE